MHFIRGAGLAGLKGMVPRTVIPTFDAEIPIVRPLLDVWREETIVYCASHGLRPRHDPSNASIDFFRNRLRHLLIPALEMYNPRLREVIWRTSRSLAGDLAYPRGTLTCGGITVAGQRRSLTGFAAKRSTGL